MNPVDRLRHAMAGPWRPRGGDFHDVAKRVARVPDAELAVTEAALSDGGAIADRLIRQLREAGDVWRLITDDGTYELRISTTDDLRVPGRSPVRLDIGLDPRHVDWCSLLEAGIVGCLVER